MIVIHGCTNMTEKLLEVCDLKTYFTKKGQDIRAVDGVGFYINEGETLGIVGESGCGKTVTSLSIMGLLPEPYGHIMGGEIWFQGKNLLQKKESQMCKIRGNEISMIFQEPMTSLNPVFKCGDQIVEAIKTHMGLNHREAMKRALEMLKLVGIPSPEKRAQEYPHQLSGGMRQRVMIAMALSCNPKLLIADEPTTALDVTIQAQILDLMKKLKEQIGMAIMLITHDLGVIAEMADRVIVMYAGNVVEEADVHSLFTKPLHPYTQGLLRSIPKIEGEVETLYTIKGSVPNPLEMPAGCCFSPRCPYVKDVCHSKVPELHEINKKHKVACWFWSEEVKIEEKNLEVVWIEERHKNIKRSESNKIENLLEVKNLKKYFPIRKGFFRSAVDYVKAVDDISFTVRPGETFGLVGESGCGKTTLGKAIIRLIEADAGQILFEGKDILKLNHEEMRKMRRNIQVIFQDPYASLNPRMTVEQIISEPMIVYNVASHAEINKRAQKLIETVELSSHYNKRYPHEFSGGQRQRIGIARALALNPKLIICDEPVSALDVSIQSQILNLLKDLQGEFGLSYIFIAHGLAVVKHISNRVGVMYLGKMVELTTSKELFKSPLHPYTQALISAIPMPKPTFGKKERVILQGDVPSSINPPNGCYFHTRCRYAIDKCKEREPEFVDVGKSHYVACHIIKQ